MDLYVHKASLPTLGHGECRQEPDPEQSLPEAPIRGAGSVLATVPWLPLGQGKHPRSFHGVVRPKQLEYLCPNHLVVVRKTNTHNLKKISFAFHAHVTLDSSISNQKAMGQCLQNSEGVWFATWNFVPCLVLQPLGTWVNE